MWRNHPHGTDFRRVSLYSWDSDLGSSGISCWLEDKAKWLSIFILKFTELSMTCMSPLLTVCRMGCTYRWGSGYLWVDFSGTRKETPWSPWKTLGSSSSWVLVDLSVSTIWGRGVEEAVIAVVWGHLIVGIARRMEWKECLFLVHCT